MVCTYRVSYMHSTLYLNHSNYLFGNRLVPQRYHKMIDDRLSQLFKEFHRSNQLLFDQSGARHKQ